MRMAMERMEILLKAGADPELAVDGSLTPLRYAQSSAQSFIHREGEQSEKGKLCKALVSMMEKYIN